MHADLSILYSAQKTFPFRSKWQFRDAEWMVLTSPIDIDGVTVEGLKFRAMAMRQRPDEHVSFQLEYYPPRRQPRGGPFARIEWRPLRGHNNKMIGPPELRNKLQKCTHHHEFWVNWNHSQNSVRKGALDISVPIEPEPSYDQIVAFVGKEFRISNIDWLPSPDWSATMF
ncbi:MAG: hypothetical protein EOR84_32770 [Mesorhizobium sp.]|uniref:hypothetical protein n=1 Tax=Mesorhizobium sp. TaxID=1871066 RepID=UPI000FE49215|nr:hypothetical protein [Mesorhizobium sp.]RWM84819.1 MAG: hypothetical protein EOR84_32770 [Mesorhizobium sp.]